MISTWAGVTERWDFGGGMTSSGSLESIRWMIALRAGSPGTMAAEPSEMVTAESRSSSRRSASRCLGSWPWQWKQFSERMGRTSRL